MKNHRNLINLIGITILSMGLTMVSSFILARFLSVDERGAYQLFVTTVSYLVTISTGGVGFALALSMKNKQYLHWRIYLFLFLIVATIIAIIAVNLFKFTQFHLLFVINVILTAILTMTLEKSKIDPSLKTYRILTFQQPVLLVLIYGLAYWLLGEQPLELAIQLFTIFSIIQALACVFYLLKIERGFLKQEKNISIIDRAFFVKTWLKQNLYQAFGSTISSLDKYLIVFFLGNYALGLYTVCLAFDALLTKFINMLSDYYYSGLLNKLNRLKSVLWVISAVSFAAILITPWVSEYIVGFFFSDKYIEVAPILIWFILNSIIAGVSWLLSQSMLIQGKQILLFTRQVVSIIVFVLLFYCLKQYSLYGLAFSLIGASLTRLLISILYYFKYPIATLGIK